MNSWAVEVIADPSNKWVGNELRFKTKEGAEDYGRRLIVRWLAVRDWRVVESEDPPNQET